MGAVVLVAVDASKEITDYALEWAIQNVVQPADTLIFLAMLKSPALSRSSSLSFSNRNNQSGVQHLLTFVLKKWHSRIGNETHTGKRVVDQISIKKINEVCGEMMNELRWEYDLEPVRTHVVVTHIPSAHIGSVADKAQEYKTRWLILDRRLKKESESCLKQLDCNIILIDHAIPKILRLIDASPPLQESDNTDVFPLLRHKDDSTETSSNRGSNSSFTVSGSLGSSTDMEDPMTKGKHQEKAFSEGRSSVDSRSKVQRSSELLTETKAGAVMSSIRCRGADDGSPRSSSTSPDSSSKISGTPGSSTCMDGTTLTTMPTRDFSPSRPLRSSEFNNHHKPLVPTKGASKDRTSDAFSQRRRPAVSPTANKRSHETPNKTKRLTMVKSFKQPNDLARTAPWAIDRMSSIRRAISLSTFAPPLCSVCRHRAPAFGKPPRRFSYEEMERATEGFAAANFLAEGRYGSVYKGVLEDGQVVAVKQHKMVSAQGAAEFCSAMEVLNCAQHRNLVMLIGYCMEKEWLLVSEFVCNRSLSTHLHGNGMEVMAWHHRKKVALGAARGLRYLHEDCRVGCIVHRDFNSKNIFLTHDFEPMVGDFCLARWQMEGHFDEETHIVGTFGYVAPEFTQTMQITEKVDVYAFGVMLMELLSGEKAIDLARCTGQQSLFQWVSTLMDRNMIYGLIDPRLNGYYDEHEVERMMNVAALCISPHPELRPRMSKVLRMLEGEMLDVSAAYQHTETPVASIPRLRATSGPIDAIHFSRADQAIHTLLHKKSSNFATDEFITRRRGNPIAEQHKDRNAMRPPLTPQTYKVEFDDMIQAGNKITSNQNEQLASREYQACHDDIVVEYMHLRRELATQDPGTYHTTM